MALQLNRTRVYPGSPPGHEKVSVLNCRWYLGPDSQAHAPLSSLVVTHSLRQQVIRAHMCVPGKQDTCGYGSLQQTSLYLWSTINTNERYSVTEEKYSSLDRITPTFCPIKRHTRKTKQNKTQILATCQSQGHELNAGLLCSTSPSASKQQVKNIQFSMTLPQTVLFAEVNRSRT